MTITSITSYLTRKLVIKPFQYAANLRLAPGTDVVPSEIVPSEFGPGCILLAQPEEFNHFLVKAAVFIHEQNSRGTGGVILERKTAFSLGETAPGIGPFAPNTLFMGGESGSDTALMFHKYDLRGNSKYVGSGIFVGGVREAKEMVQNRLAHPRDFKFIFNQVTWAPGVLEKEISNGRWDIVKAPPHLILSQDSKTSLWEMARNKLVSMGKITGEDLDNDDE